MEEKRKTSKVSAWGIRLTVPAECIRWLGLKVGDKVEWDLIVRDGRKREVILRKAEEVSDSND